MAHPPVPNNKRLEREGEGDSRSMPSAVALDWRGRPSSPAKHGGMRPAAFVLGMPPILSYISLSLFSFSSYIHT